MGVRIQDRGSYANNTMIFLVLSIVFLHVLISISNGISAINLKLFYQSMVANYPLVGLMFVTLFLIYFAKRASKVFFVVFVTLISLKNLSIYFINFDKVLLLFSFVYILLSIYFFVLWHQELEVVVYWPGFMKNDVGKINVYDVPIQITADNNKKIADGMLTNWGEFECFALLNSGDFIPKGRIKAHIKFENKDFFQEGRIVTSYGDGVGIKFNDVKYGEYSGNGWLDLFTIMSHRGYCPRNVRV